MQYSHYAQLPFIQAKKYGEKNAFYYRDENDNSWKGISWNNFAFQIKSTAKALFEAGLSNQQNIAVFSQNKPESFVVDFATFAIRSVVVPIYATSTVEQLAYIINDASISIIFVGEQYQYDIAYEVMKISESLKQLVIFDDKVIIQGEESSIFFKDFIEKGKDSSSHFEIESCQEKATSEDLATIMYTSGTTGEPKGVMLTHANYLEAMRIHDLRLTTITSDDTSIAFLPVSHIFERTWSYYCLHKAVEVYVNLRPQEIQQAIKEVRPTLMCSVPRFWEKVYAGVLAIVDSYNPFMQGLVTWAVAVGSKHNLDFVRVNKKPSFWLKISYAIADKLIFSKVKKSIGIENANFLPVAGAALSDEITIFFRSIGVPILYGYGLTETTATVSCFNYIDYTIGSVGALMPDIEVKIGKENEILVKGKTVFQGYYKKPELNAIAFTEDGFFRTGDAGLVENSEIFLTDRIKDLFKTSNGKYIAPQYIETVLVLDKFIEQAIVIGDQRNFVSAIIVPNLLELKNLAVKKSINYEDRLDVLLKNEQIIAFYSERIIYLQKSMAGFEQIKKFILAMNPFSIETGELTNTLKLRRAFILHKYKKQIDKMYND